MRVTAVAAFAIQQAYSCYPQVLANYTPHTDYFPPVPRAGVRGAVRLGRAGPRRGYVPAAPEGPSEAGPCNALYAEWTKTHTLASTGWLLLAVVTLTVAVGAAVASGVSFGHLPRGPRRDQPDRDLPRPGFERVTVTYTQ